MKMNVATLGASLALSLFAIESSASADQQFCPNGATICQTGRAPSGCTTYNASDALNEALSVGLPVFIKELCGPTGTYSQCPLGGAAQVAFEYDNPRGDYWTAPVSDPDTSQFQSFGQTRPYNPQNSPLYLSCARTSTAYWQCKTGTGGPGWSWTLTMNYHDWWLP